MEHAAQYSQYELTTLRKIISEANEHTYAGWSGVTREFNMTQVIEREEKCRNYNDNVFHG